MILVKTTPPSVLLTVNSDSYISAYYSCYAPGLLA